MKLWPKHGYVVEEYSSNQEKGNNPLVEGIHIISIPEIPLMHIWSQHAWHDESYIVANREGLLAIRAAIDRALITDEVAFAETFVADGEGYHTFVIPQTVGGWQEFSKQAVPYIDDMAKDRHIGQTTIAPWKHPKLQKYIKEQYDIDKQRQAE